MASPTPGVDEPAVRVPMQAPRWRARVTCPSGSLDGAGTVTVQTDGYHADGAAGSAMEPGAFYVPHIFARNLRASTPTTVVSIAVVAMSA